MTQSALSIPNEAGAAFRADTNTAHQANATFQSGASAPGTTYADQYWWDTTNQVLKKRNQANSAWIVIGTRDEAFVLSRSSNTILGLSDYGKTIVATSTFTQTLTAVATLGDGWFCYYRNDGTGLITFDPNASETIDGLTTMVLQPGEGVRISCNGSLFKTAGRAGLGTVVKRKTADESVSSSTTLQDDDHLVFPIGANEEWTATYRISCGAALSTTGVKVAVTFPSGATAEFDIEEYNDSAGPALSGRTTSSGTAALASTPSPAGSGMLSGHLWILNGATAGNVTLQWAQNASSATALTFRKGSFLTANRAG